MANNTIEIEGLDGTKDALDGLLSTNEATWTIQADVDYAVYVELGTSKMAAQPFLRPAIASVMGGSKASQIAANANSVEELVEGLAEAIAEEARSNAPVDSGRLKNSIEAKKVS